MRTHVLGVRPIDLVSHVSRMMRDMDEPYAIIIQDAKPIGIVSEKDIVRKVVATNANPDKVKVQEIMSSPLVTVEATASLKNAARIMEEKNVRRLPVLQEEKILGIILAVDFAKHIGSKKGFLEIMADSMAYQSLPPYPI